MSNFYTYLIAQLPLLQFGMKPPFTFREFLLRCKDFIPDDDYAVLAHLSEIQEYAGEPEHPFIQEWINFDRLLRNALVKIRAARKHVEPGQYLRPADFRTARIDEVAMSAYRNPSLIEGERVLDRLRWEELEELVRGHHFDLEYLLAFGYKLLILERWEKIRTTRPETVLDTLIGSSL